MGIRNALKSQIRACKGHSFLMLFLELRGRGKGIEGYADGVGLVVVIGVPVSPFVPENALLLPPHVIVPDPFLVAVLDAPEYRQVLLLGEAVFVGLLLGSAYDGGFPRPRVNGIYGYAVLVHGIHYIGVQSPYALYVIHVEEAVRLEPYALYDAHVLVIRVIRYDHLRYGQEPVTEVSSFLRVVPTSGEGSPVHLKHFPVPAERYPRILVALVYPYDR